MGGEGKVGNQIGYLPFSPPSFIEALYKVEWEVGGGGG